MIKELFKLVKNLFKKIDINKPCQLVKMKYIPFGRFDYMAWCGDIIYKEDRYSIISQEDLWHETIHKLQAYYRYKRWYRYYLNYLGQWIRYGFKYSKIPYEKEAYANQHNPNYQVTKDSYKQYK